MAWTAAEADGRVQKQGGPRQKGKNSLFEDPRVHFAKQFGSTAPPQRAAAQASASAWARLTRAASTRSASSKCDTAL